MGRSGVHALDATPGSLGVLATGLAAALDGSGPAVLPLPAGPRVVRKALVDAFRPDDPSAAADVEGLALVVPTSGSTGVPKGALLSASAIRASATAAAARLSGPGHWVLALPLTHVAGLMVLARAHLAGSVPVVGARNFVHTARSSSAQRWHPRSCWTERVVPGSAS